MNVFVLKCKRKGKLNILSWLIRLFQQTEYSHFALRVGDLVIDSTLKGVRFNASWEYKSRYTITEEEMLPRETTLTEFINWSLPHLNKSYGVLQIIGLALITIKLIKNNPFGANEKRLTCNELLLIHIKDFYNVTYSDGDDLDLNATEKIYKGIINKE